jgi:drug/metabolite transporter (DMT)-like permease
MVNSSALSVTKWMLTLNTVNNLYLFYGVYVSMQMGGGICVLNVGRYYASVPYPITGPPEVRHLLAFRGVSGFFGQSNAFARWEFADSASGLFGIYYSLIYLSLSDSVVITFLTPTTTAIAGYLLLGETLTRREMIAGCGSNSLLKIARIICTNPLQFAHFLASY